MFCLFKNSHLVPWLHKLTVSIAWAAVLYWAYFAFVQKAFLEKMFSGNALFVDLLFGLPIVLIFSVVIYAMIYWAIKVVVILLYPAWLETREITEPVDESLPSDLEENYWQKTAEETSLEKDYSVSPEKTKAKTETKAF